MLLILVFFRLTPQLLKFSYNNVVKYSYNASQSDGFQQLMNEANDLQETAELQTGHRACLIILLLIMFTILAKEGIELYLKVHSSFFLSYTVR